MPRLPSYLYWDEDEVFRLLDEGTSGAALGRAFGVSASTGRRAKNYYSELYTGISPVPEIAARTEAELEEKLREALYYGIENASRDFSESPKLNIGTSSADPDLWIINGYESERPGHSYPMEIHIRYNRDLDRFEMIKFELRGKRMRGEERRFQARLGF